MVNELPLITIGIPTYNRYKQLQSCLEVVLSQSYTYIEVLISDNTQHSETPLWLYDLLNKDKRLRYVKQPKNLGAIGNHQYLINHAIGDYFMFLHDDDMISIDYVKTLMSHIFVNPSVSLIGPRCDRYLDGEYWLTYENWDSRGKNTFTRLNDLIPDAFIYHWRFEQYMYGIFKLTGLNYKMSKTFKSQFHLFFLLSSIGELMCAENVTIIKNTTTQELEKYKTGSTYRRYSLLKIFSDNDVKSAQQCIPISIQMISIIILSSQLNIKEKAKLIYEVLKQFKLVVIRQENIVFKSKYKKLKSKIYKFFYN